MKKIIYFLICLLIGSIETVFAQYSTVEKTEEFGGTKQSASSILTNRTVDGRFGLTNSGGYLSPSPDRNSRLNSGGIFTKSGSFLGINNNTSNSRFQEYWNDPSYYQQNSQESFNDYLAALRFRREQEKIRNEQFRQDAPQAVQAAPLPEEYNFRSSGNLDYYSSGQYQAQNANIAEAPLASPASSGAGPRIQNFRDQPLRNTSANGYSRVNPPLGAIGSGNNAGYSQSGQNASGYSGVSQDAIPGNGSVLFSGGADNRNRLTNGNSSGQTVSNGLPDQNTTAHSRDNSGSRVVGGLHTSNANNWTGQQGAENFSRQNQNSAAIPLQGMRQDPTAAFKEYLELMLLRSPDVNPLSPIQVTYSRGVATIQGIVPTDKHKLAAGKILLSDSRVKAVDNRLTVMPSDPNAPLPPVFDPNLPQPGQSPAKQK